MLHLMPRCRAPHMFSSRKRNTYQVIDGEYDEPDLRTNGVAGLNPFVHNNSFVQNNYTTGTESAPLIANRVEMGNQAEPDREEPLAMATSSDEARRWDHITDLDEFFRRVYDYHQGGGFLCLCFSALWSLFQFLFIVFVSTFFVECIDYDILFNKNATATLGMKRHFGDAIVDDCASHLHPFIIFCIIVAVFYWSFLVIRTAVLFLRLREIQMFYRTVLHIEDADLTNITWNTIVDAICKVQGRVFLMVNNESVSPIEIYHRILRYKNYMVAMVTQELLPPLINLPFIGDLHYLPEQLKLNLEWLLFWGFCSPFKSSCSLQDEFKDPLVREQLAENMEKTVLYLGMANLVLSPLIFLYSCFYYLFAATDLTKRDSGALGNRSYTNYGRYRVRHFNELDHELKGRLSRSHVYASAYLSQFYSPLVVLCARHISFVAAAIFVPLSVLSVWDEDVLQIEHMLTVITLLGFVFVVCKSAIPDEHLVFQPEALLQQVVSELHYGPDHWRMNAHDMRVVHEVERLFRLRAFNLLEEISAPLLTPYVLLFHIRPSCRAIISFLAENTERQEGVGDVCSFALLDVARHGDPTYEKNIDEDCATEKKEQLLVQPTGEAAHEGKTEMSVMAFAARHPEWQPPLASARFISRLNSRMERDALSLGRGGHLNPLVESVSTVIATPVVGMASILHGAPMGGLLPMCGIGMERGERGLREGGHLERSLRRSGNENIVDSLRGTPGADMRVSALYLRALRRNNKVYSSIGPSEEAAFAMPFGAPSFFQSPVPEEGTAMDEIRGRLGMQLGDDSDDELPPRLFPV